MTNQPWSLQSFLGSLERRLQEMSAEEIRRSLLLHAEGLPDAEREAFYTIFTPTGPADQDGAPDVTWPIEHDPLLDEIDDFVNRLASGEYFEGFGWDHELYEERSFGDESWVIEFDNLLSNAQNAFLTGRLGLARAAYQRLLSALALDEEIGTFSGPEPAPDMVDTDLTEAHARYLRAIYETTPADQRTAVLIQAWFEFPHLADVTLTDATLTEVRESRRQDLPHLEQFLADWITELHSFGSTGAQLRKLLTEATELSGGLDGLRDLARQNRPDQADHYLQWVQALRRAGRHIDATNAAREALETLAGYGSVKALIAEELADLTNDDTGEVLAARRIAWRASPDITRLLTLHQAASHITDATEAMAVELTELETSANLDRLSDGLRAALMVLSGRADDMVDTLHEPTDLGPQPEHEVLVPYLLASGCAGPGHAVWESTQLSALLATVDYVNPRFGSANFDILTRDRPSDDTMPRLSHLLLEQIIAEEDDPQVLAKRLDAAVQAVCQQADIIVSSKARGQYPRAAELLTCCAEALTLANRADAAIALVREWRTRYSRHSAFQRELTAAIEQTPLLAT